MTPAPATVDWKRMDEDLKAYLEGMEARAVARDQATRERVTQVETALLTEFHKWASPVEMRIRSHAAALRALDLEQESLTERVEKLERPGPS